MLAVVGFIVPEFVRIPGEAYSFEAIPRVNDAHDALMASGPMGQLLLWIGLWDLIITAPAAVAASQGEREPGGTYQPFSYCIDLVTTRTILNLRCLISGCIF